MKTKNSREGDNATNWEPTSIQSGSTESHEKEREYTVT